MFVRQRNKKRPNAIYKIRHEDVHKYSTLQDVLEIIKQFGFPYTVTELSTRDLNLIVYAPNNILEFELERRMY